MSDIPRDDLLRLAAAVPAASADDEVILRPDGARALAMLRQKGQPPRAFVLDGGNAVESLPTRYLLPNVPLFTFAVAPAAAHYARRCPSVGAVGRAMVRALGLLGAAALLVLPFLSAPLPLRSALFALVAALTPRLVTTPRRLLAMCFWLPVLAGWTVLADYRDRWEGGPRARAPFGPMLAAELDLLGTDVRRDLHAFGHVPGGLLLGADLLPAGHEAAVRQPTARFVLREDDREPPLPDLPGYAERLRFCVPGEVLVVEERAGSGK